MEDDAPRYAALSADVGSRPGDHRLAFQRPFKGPLLSGEPAGATFTHYRLDRDLG